MKILQINNLDSNKIGLTEDVKVKNVRYFPENITEDITLIGFSDGNEISSLDIDKLIEIRNAGKTIIFSHGNPSRFSPPVERLDEERLEEKDYSAEENEYLEKLMSNFGVDGFEKDFEYKFYDRVKIRKLDSPLVVGLPEEFAIQETHGIGIRLSYDCKIILDNPAIPNLQTNYYLATFEETGKGKVIFWDVGHCHFGQMDIRGLKNEEQQILTRLLS